MLTLLSRGVGFIICVVFICIGVWVAIKKFLRTYIIVSEYNEAKKKHDAAKATQTASEAK